MATPKILIIYTGGTIGMGKDPVTGVLEPLDFNHLVSSMPEFKLIQAEIDVRKFDPPIDSSDMDPMRWAEIVSMIANNYNDYDGFVILHGTDTMAYTSSALSFMLENLTKPVILTGSQLPIGELRTDGKENLMTAIEIASAKDENGRPMVPEVSEATVPSRSMPRDSTPSNRSTIRISATWASISSITSTTSSLRITTSR